MGIHLHFADEVFSATADIQYHVHDAENVVLGVHLVVNEANHTLTSQGPWAAVTNDQVHIHTADSITLEVILEVDETKHLHYPDGTFFLSPWLIGLDTYHIHRVDGPWAVYVYADETIHTTADHDNETGSTVKVLSTFWEGLSSSELPSLEAVAYGGGYVDVELPALTSTATGYNNYVGDTDAELPMFTATAFGGGVGNVLLPALSADADGYMSEVGTTSDVESALPMITIEGVGWNSSNSVGQVTLPMFRAAATGMAGIASTANITLPQLDIDATGIIGVVGTASATLGRMSATGTGYTVPTGDVSTNLPMIVIDADGASSSTRYCSVTLEHTR